MTAGLSDHESTIAPEESSSTNFALGSVQEREKSPELVVGPEISAQENAGHKMTIRINFFIINPRR
jgi:hypothetical protein